MMRGQKEGSEKGNSNDLKDNNANSDSATSTRAHHKERNRLYLEGRKAEHQVHDKANNEANVAEKELCDCPVCNGEE